VAHAIDLLKLEVDRDLALQGIQTPRDMAPQHLIRLSGVRAPGMPV